MRILMMASEAAPFAKTGGLADVVGALPKELARRGHDVRIIIPLYRSIDRSALRLLPVLPGVRVAWNGLEFRGDIQRALYPGVPEVTVYFVQQDSFFARGGLYGDGKHDYPDNDLRFGFFCFAAMWTLTGLQWRPDIVHLHDWQAGLAAALLRHHPLLSVAEFFRDTRTVLTIHNLAYQGVFPADMIPKAELPWTVFSAKGMEFHGHVSYLKAGIAYSDRITTVSPTYAHEIQTPEFGAGMDGTLRERADVIDGILNGIDESVWNPATDRYLPAHYSAEKPAGKKRCRAALLERFDLKARADEPVIGIVSRLVDQKGFDLVTAIMPQLLEMPVRLVVLGTGAKKYEEFFRETAAQHPRRVAATIAYSEELAHLIEAGADIFLMPSRFEPSGLNQLYSMSYGTLPVVRHVGGLADSVVNADDETIRDGTATGFSFLEYEPERLLEEIRRAVAMFRERPAQWAQLTRNAMRRDSSWSHSASVYEEVYRRALAQEK